MDKLINLLTIFSKYYPNLKNIEIEIGKYNNLYIARCLVNKTSDYINVKKGRILNIIPKKIIMTDVAMKKKDNELLFIFIHECSHAITPHRERKVKNKFIRIDHSREFYENFLKLLNIAYNNKLINQKFNNIEELMKKDKRKENANNDLKLYEFQN